MAAAIVFERRNDVQIRMLSDPGKEVVPVMQGMPIISAPANSSRRAEASIAGTGVRPLPRMNAVLSGIEDRFQ